MLKSLVNIALCNLAAASLVATAQTSTSPAGKQTGSDLPTKRLAVRAERAARELVNTLGAQQTFAMLGWQQNPDYMPPEHCFDYWHNAKPLDTQKTLNCAQHVRDLSRLYASYGVDAPPIVFKSEYYWDEKARFDRLWPELVEKWRAAGGRKDDISFLQHPVCARPLQQGWTGSEYFYDGREHPVCRAHKTEQLENNQRQQARPPS